VTKGLFFANRITNVQQSAGMSKTSLLLERLGLPPKPLKPPSLFLNFLHKNEPNLKEQFPHLNRKGLDKTFIFYVTCIVFTIFANFTEILKIASYEWNRHTPKEKKKYAGTFYSDLEAYKLAINEYTKNLTEEQKIQIKEAKLRAKETKINNSVKRVIYTSNFLSPQITKNNFFRQGGSLVNPRNTRTLFSSL